MVALIQMQLIIMLMLQLMMDLVNIPLLKGTDSTACNYDASATNGFFIYSNTDANMTIALEYTVGLTAGLESGDIIGVFYTDNFGNLFGGTAQWNNESLAIAAWGTESGLDNGLTWAKNLNLFRSLMVKCIQQLIQ